MKKTGLALIIFTIVSCTQRSDLHKEIDIICKLAHQAEKEYMLKNFAAYSALIKEIYRYQFELVEKYKNNSNSAVQLHEKTSVCVENATSLNK